MFKAKNLTIMKTPKDKLTLLMWSVLIYISAPIFEWFNLEHLLVSGRLPVNADSIGLGFAFFVIGWILGIPVVSAFIYWILCKYPPEVSLFGFDPRHPLWSFVWTLIFAFLVFDSFALIFINLSENYVVGVFQNFLLIYLFLLLRAAIVFRKGEN